MTEDQFRRIINEEVTRAVGEEVTKALERELPKVLEKQLPAALEKQLPLVLEKQLPLVLGREMPKILHKELAVFYGQVTHYVDKNIKDFRTEVKRDHDRIYTLLDGIAGRLTSDEQERAALGHEQKRHKGWIKQLAHATETKLRPDIS